MPVRLCALLVVLAVGAGCGAAPVHYRVGPALQCLQRTNSTRGGGTSNSIFLVFVSDDGVSAVEPVFVAFGRARLVGAVPGALGMPGRLPHWSTRRGDASVSGYGPYEPPIAKRRGVTDAQAKAAATALDRSARAAIDACLTENEGSS